jgi:hypothetical protein
MIFGHGVLIPVCAMAGFKCIFFYLIKLSFNNFIVFRSPQKDSLVYEESKKTVEFEADGR